MASRLTPFLFVLLFCRPASAIHAEDNPRAIVDRAIQALGGEEVLRQPRAVHIKAKGILHELDGVKFSEEIDAQLPQRYRLTLSVDLGGMKLTIARILNGDKGWERTNDERHEVTKPDLIDMQQSAYVTHLGSLAPFVTDKNLTLTLEGEAAVQGKTCAVVKVAAKGQPDVKMYFEKSTGLPIKTEYRAKSPDTGKEELRAEVFGEYREVNLATGDERMLQAANIATDAPALLEFLRKRTPPAKERMAFQKLVRSLGDASFETREKAKEDLLAKRETAWPYLYQAKDDPDPEIASRVKECLQALGDKPDLTQIPAVIRLLAQKKPAGVVDVLLDYLPNAPSAAVRKEVQSALHALANHDGKPDPALVAASKSSDPERRKAAAAALAKEAKDDESSGRRLFIQGIKRPMKGSQYRDDKKVLDWEITDVQFFSQFDESVFAKP